MSSKTNQSSGTAEYQPMAALATMCAATSSRIWREEKDSFLGKKKPAEQKDTESDEVTPVEASENTSSKDKQELDQCHRYSKKGQKDGPCKQQATVRPYQGIR